MPKNDQPLLYIDYDSQFEVFKLLKEYYGTIDGMDLLYACVKPDRVIEQLEDNTVLKNKMAAMENDFKKKMTANEQALKIEKNKLVVSEKKFKDKTTELAAKCDDAKNYFNNTNCNRCFIRCDYSPCCKLYKGSDIRTKFDEIKKLTND